MLGMRALLAGALLAQASTRFFAPSATGNGQLGNLPGGAAVWVPLGWRDGSVAPPAAPAAGVSSPTDKVPLAWALVVMASLMGLTASSSLQGRASTARRRHAAPVLGAREADLGRTIGSVYDLNVLEPPPGRNGVMGQMVQLFVRRTPESERFTTLESPAQELVLSSGLRILDAERECAEELGNAEWSAKLTQVKEELKAREATFVQERIQQEEEAKRQMDELDFLHGESIKKVQHELQSRESTFAEERIQKNEAVKKQMDEIARLHREAIAKAIDDERSKRVQAEKTVAEQSKAIQDLGESAYDKIQLECDKLRKVYEERLKVQEERERVESAKLRKLFEERLKGQEKREQEESGKLRKLFDERIKVQEERERLESGKLRALYEERIKVQEEREKELRSTLSDMVIRKNNSSNKGQDAEGEADELLNQLFPASEIADCRSKKGQGDFVVHQGNVSMMVEVKSYTRNVHKKEVEKFMRDMRSNPGYTCGVIASLDTGIAGWNDFSLKCVDGRPVVFLHNVRETPEKLQHAFSVFEMIQTIENLDLRNESVMEAVQQEMKEKQRRNKALRSMSEKHAAEVIEWVDMDETRSIATLKLIAGQVNAET